MRLFDLLFPPRVDEAALRTVSVGDFLALVAPRLVPETRPGTVVLLPFSDPSVRGAIHEAKYHGSARAFKFLALALAEYLRDADDLPKIRSDLENSGLRSNLILVPVPLGKTRHKERGFNQVEEVARRALRSLGEAGPCPFVLEPNLLERVKETQTQVSLERRRREENMHGAFRATRRADPSLSYIVIDDVLTTGATLQAAIDALKEAEALHIIPLALAH